MLISMPTGTSTIFGAFQAIWLSFCFRTDSALGGKVLRIKKFASEIFSPALCCIAKQFTLLCGGPRAKQREIKRFAVARSDTKADFLDRELGRLPIKNL